MAGYSIRAFANELRKIAAPRATKEWQAAMARGDEGTADAIAKAYGDIQAKPRYLKDVSRGGYEAGVDLMMGGAKEELPGGYIIRKLYKPDSPLHGRGTTREVLELKKEITDKAREMPKAKLHVPAMAGFEQKGKWYRPRFTSQHEYIPKMKTLHDLPHLGENIANILEGRVLRPLSCAPWAPLGMDDTVMRSGLFGNLQINYGNIGLVGDKQKGFVPKILDFLPVKDGRNPARNYEREMGLLGLGFNPEARSVGELRKDVFKGQPGSREIRKVRVGPPGIPEIPETSSILKHLRNMPRSTAIALAAVPAAAALGTGLWYRQKRQREQQEQQEQQQEEQQKAAGTLQVRPQYTGSLPAKAGLSKIAGPIGRERMLYGALGGAALGGAAGAVADHGSRGRGALIGALGGGALGAGAGALYNKLNPVLLGKPSLWSQPLDNTAPDTLVHGMGMRPKTLADSNHVAERQKLVRDISEVGVKGKIVYSVPHAKVIRLGHNVLVEVTNPEIRDQVGRLSPVVVRYPGGAEQDPARLVDAARRYVQKAVPDKWPKTAARKAGWT